MPEQQQQDDDRDRNAEQPQQNSLAHDPASLLVSVAVQLVERSSVPRKMIGRIDRRNCAGAPNRHEE
jgi:hypothetical protein